MQMNRDAPRRPALRRAERNDRTIRRAMRHNRFVGFPHKNVKLPPFFHIFFVKV